MPWIDLDGLIEGMDRQIEGWRDALGRGARAGTPPRPPASGGGLDAACASAGVAPADLFRSPERLSLASFAIRATVELPGAAAPPRSRVRVRLASPTGETAGAAATARTSSLEVELDGAADGTVRLGDWQAGVSAGRRSTDWSRPADAAAETEPGLRRT